MIITAKLYNNSYTNNPTNNNTRNISICNKKFINQNNIIEKNKAIQMHYMNMKYENIADDILDYNNKPTGLFVIP